MLVLSDCANNSRLVSTPTCEPCGFDGGMGVPPSPWPRRAPHLCPRRCTDTFMAAHSRLRTVARLCLTQSSCHCPRRLCARSRTLYDLAHGTGRTAVLAERLCWPNGCVGRTAVLAPRCRAWCLLVAHPTLEALPMPRGWAKRCPISTGPCTHMDTSTQICTLM